MKLFGKELTNEQTVQACKAISQDKCCDGCLLADGVEKLLTEIDRLQELNAKYIEMLTNQWISVEERLPDTTMVLGCNIEGFVTTVIYMCNAKKWAIAHNMRVTMDVTHWMPLPEPPKGDEN